MWNIREINPILMNSEYVIDKFVDYQNFYPPVHVIFLDSYIEKNKLSDLEIIKLLFMNCYAYSDIGAIYLYENYWKMPDELLIKNTVFTSARLKFKVVNKFKKFMEYINKNINQERYERYKHIKTWKELQEIIIRVPEIWQFSSDLFVEYVEYSNYAWKWKIFTEISARETEKDWSSWANETMCISLLYCDYDWFEKLQWEYRKNGHYNLSPNEIKKLEAMKDRLIEEITARYWKKPWWIFKGKLCSYKNLFSGKRYAWYHFWRQYEQIQLTKKVDVELGERLENLRNSTFKPYQTKEKFIDKQRMKVWCEKWILWVEIDWVLY